MADDFRTCRRTGCRWPAVASLSYRYATRQVWVLDLNEEPDPSCYDLCPHHADTLTVPNGWERVDERTMPAPVVEPAAPERAWTRPVLVGVAASPGATGAANGPPSDPAAPSASASAARSAPRRTPGAAWDDQPPSQARHDRYAALHAELPRLAAEVSGPPAPYLGPVASHPSAGPSAGSSAVSRPTPREAVPVPSRELAPVAPERAEILLGPAPPEVDGQLTMPVTDARAAGAVVVSIERHRRPPDERRKG